MPDEDFDAVAAAKELDELLGTTGGETAAIGASGDYVAQLEDEIEQLTAEAAAREMVIAKKDAEIAKANARADQAHAEIESAGKRIAKASATELEQRMRKLLEGFLPVVDDLDRGIIAAKKITESADVVEGLELIRRSLLSRLGSFGVTHLPALGEAFDPNRHDAIALVPVTDAAQDGKVIDVMREGYLIGDATLRPASVAVGKK